MDIDFSLPLHPLCGWPASLLDLSSSSLLSEFSHLLSGAWYTVMNE